MAVHSLVTQVSSCFQVKKRVIALGICVEKQDEELHTFLFCSTAVSVCLFFCLSHL